jgi:LemA protein
MITYIVLAVVVVVVLWLVLAYNGLVRTRTQAQEAFSDIDVQLKRRYDLIPNLVSTVQGYAAHEKTVFEDVTKARSQAMQATGSATRRARKISFQEHVEIFVRSCGKLSGPQGKPEFLDRCRTN